ncbi:MAG: hybrid sensor histidine kinase/response regulator [Myxococcales bacterium]
MTIDSTQATIMIIDDEPDNLNVLGEMLRHEGWEVRAFPRGEMALAAAREELPDLVLLDIRMPGVDGYEVCRRFKADERLRSIPVIFLSAFTEPSDKLRAFEAGGVDYVTKPFAETEVLARTHTHLRLRRYQIHLEDLVSERVKELAEAHRRLRIWDDAKSQWLRTLAHEMRTPLTGVFGIAELLFLELPPASKLHDLRTDYDLSRSRTKKLMDDALTLAEIDVAAEGFAANPMRLAPVLRNALSAVARQISDCKVRSSLAAVEHVTVSAAPELLTRAFTDLLLTATCCVSGGEAITLETSVCERQAHVVIATDGKALSREAIETFFEVGGQRMHLKGGGDFGLGPPLASRTLRLFNGHVSVRNGPERGLIIEISLPAE